MKWCLTVVVLAGCMTPVMTFGEGKTAKQAQHDTLVSFLPAQLSTEGGWRGPIATAKIRVYADERYRAQNLSWRQTFGESLDYANAVLGPSFGVRLVAEYREWNYHAPASTLADDLAALEELDPGKDVLTVVGLTSSLALVSATFDQLGLASIPGRHMMLRGYADLEERKAFAEAFPKLSSEERNNATEARRHHKLTTVLLHELGHNLGVVHDSMEETVMNAHYSEHAADFSAEARATIQRAFDQRLARASAAPASDATPQAVSAAAPAPSKKLSVLITANGVYIAGQARKGFELDSLFQRHAERDPQTEVVIETAGNVPSQVVADVQARARASGLKKITLR